MGFPGSFSAILLILWPQARDTVRAVPITAIGRDSVAAGSFMFGEISGLAFDARGRLYVTDFQEPRVVVLDSSGKVLGVIGRRGQGPGEFVAPTGPVVGPDGALYVRNLTKISRFVIEQRTDLPSRFDRYIDGPALLNWRIKTPSVIDHNARLYWPNPQTPSGGVTTLAYLRYGLDGASLGILTPPNYPNAVASTAWVRTGPGGGRMVAGLNTTPFAPLPRSAVTSQGTVVSGDGISSVLVETDGQARILRRYTSREPTRLIPVSERLESLRALRRRIDSLPIPVTILEGTTNAVKTQRLPETFPRYTGILTQSDGALWVRHWPRADTPTVFEVFDASAVYQFTLILPQVCAAEPVPVAWRRLVACVVTDSETGAESILIARLPR